MNSRGLLSRRLGVWALLVSLIGGPLGPLAVLHAEAGEDRACHDRIPTDGAAPAALVLSARGDRTNSEHCAVCHWLRAMRWAVLAGGTVSPDDASTQALDVVSPSRPASGAVLRLSARSPPRPHTDS